MAKDMCAETKTVYILEMLSPDELRPKLSDHPDLRIERMEFTCPEFNKFLHTMVGYNHRWGGRTKWSRDEWYKHVNKDGMETWVAYLSGTPAGYFEIGKNMEGEVFIHTFGLLPQFIGKGLGGHLLTRAVERAWEMGARRVQLSTCSHDHPHALKNYLARGFRIRQTRQSNPNAPIKSFWELVSGEEV
jgi:ribosomal protein S18 acetylase RimI-like enzyme